MEEAVYIALVDLKASIDKQTQVQNQLIETMKALIGALDDNSVNSGELHEALMRAKK